MATLTLSNPTPYEGGNSCSSSLFGYDGKNRVVRYTFKTGTSGATSFKLSGSIKKYGGTYDVSSIYDLLFIVTTDSTSHKNANQSSSYDGQITSTTVNVTVNRELSPNTTYYLWLFPGHAASSQYYAYDTNNNPTLSIVTTLNSYKLTTSTDKGSTITVSRTSSPLGGASTGNISSGATLYPKDVLKITFAANTGYNPGTLTVNNSNFTSGSSHTVSGNVTVKSTATVKSYTLSISAGKGSDITVKRTSSPAGGASTGNLSDGATIYHFDVLTIDTSASVGYEIKTQTCNGSSFESGDSVTVAGSISVVTITGLMGLVHIDNGSGFDMYLIYIDNGTGWDMYIPYVDNGSGWDLCS